MLTIRVLWRGETWVADSGMFLLPISEHFSVKLRRCLLVVPPFKSALSARLILAFISVSLFYFQSFFIHFCCIFSVCPCVGESSSFAGFDWFCAVEKKQMYYHL
jgi:hypothetical protein